MDKKPIEDLKPRLEGMPVLIALILFAALATHGQTILTDPVGDASGHHDAIAISGGFTRSNLYLTATFQPGSFDRNLFGFTFGLDTDQIPSSGVQVPPALRRPVSRALRGGTVRPVRDGTAARLRGTVPLSG